MRRLCGFILCWSSLALPVLAGPAGDDGSISGSSESAQSQSEPQTVFHGGIESGFLFAPDFQFTEINGKFANLAGGYAGWVVDRRFLIGGGAYTLTNGDSQRKMTYGGAVLEYFVNPDKLLNVSVRGLIGGGSATLGRNYPFDGIDFGDEFPFGDVFGRPGFGRGRIPLPDFPQTSTTVHESFFIAAPEVDVNLNLTKVFRLSFGGGYRFIGGARGLSDRLDGFSGSAALKMTFF